MSNYISEKAQIGKNVMIGNNVSIYGECHISDNCIIGDNVTIGFPDIRTVDSVIPEKSSFDELVKKPTYIGKGVKILSNTVIYSGVKIGDNTIIYEHARIGTESIIGKNCKVRYGAQIYTDVKIGDNCIISGFCCSRSKIGYNSSVFGKLVHKYDKGWIDGLKEPAPVIDENVIIAYDAIVIGSIKISKYVYVGAGAVVTKNIPSFSVVIGNNEVYEASKWLIKGKVDIHTLFGRDEP